MKFGEQLKLHPPNSTILASQKTASVNHTIPQTQYVASKEIDCAALPVCWWLGGFAGYSSEDLDGKTANPVSSKTLTIPIITKMIL